MQRFDLQGTTIRRKPQTIQFPIKTWDGWIPGEQHFLRTDILAQFRLGI